jgi:hypothetical protein
MRDESVGRGGFPRAFDIPAFDHHFTKPLDYMTIADLPA